MRVCTTSSGRELPHLRLLGFSECCVPFIQALRGKAESIRAGELEKALSKVGEGLTKKQMKAIEELSRSIVNKILHGPMTALRCDGSDPDAVGQTLANMEALERMFELARFEVPAAGRR